MREALLYKKLKSNSVQCELCNHFCVIKNNNSGICLCRVNRGGILTNIIHGKLTSINVDPIEKKPLFHFLPGSLTYSLGTYGCNFTCKNCHNWTLSQEDNLEDKSRELEEISPEKIVEDCLQNNCKSIAYTYNEPTIPLEYYLEIMKIAHKNNLKNVWVSNGFMSEKCLSLIMPYLDAVNIDLKSFEDNTYKEYFGARLEPVLSNLKTLHNEQIHLEITTLIIPGLSNDVEMLSNISNFIANNLDVDVPWHISKFSASISYNLKHKQDTSDSDIYSAYEAGKQSGLNFIYVGNMPGDQKENTYCYNCGELCIRRFTYSVERFDINGSCPKCDHILGIN